MSHLVVTSLTPRLGRGWGLRLYGVVAALARSGPVEIRYVRLGGDAPAVEYEQLGNVTLTRLHVSRGLDRGLAYAMARGRGTPSNLARGVSPGLARAAADAPAAVRVIADGLVPAVALMPAARRRKMIYLAHNFESGGFRGPAAQRGLRRIERTILRTYAESWMVTQADAAAARALAGHEVITRLVPNVVDVQAISPVRAAGAECLMFVGDFVYEPNREALRFLSEEVMPAVWRLRPGARLRVAGRGLGDPPPDPRIEVLGFVPMLADVYAACDAVLVPLLRGGGSPLKFLEGLAYGLPVVASSHAAGLIEDGVAGRDFLVARTPEEFAAAIDGLLADPPSGASIGAAGRDLALRRYSVDSLARLLAE
jgi:hypothetical protein